jgi:SNF2 family DNA or RNA helicase
MFTGEANETDRMAMVDNFQDPEQDHFVMLISTQAGGVGLNLTAANKVVIFDPDWSKCSSLPSWHT